MRRFGLTDRGLPDARVQYRFQRLSPGLVGEHEITQSATAQSASCIEYLLAEQCGYFGQGGFAALYYLTGNDIRIDDRYALVGKQVGDGRLAACDAAREPDTKRTPTSHQLMSPKYQSVMLRP
jgi:hypothetical protein